MCTTRCRAYASFEANWETLARLASRWSKLQDLNACHAPSFSHRFCGRTEQPSPAWLLGPNQETITMILRPKSPNRSCQFWDPNRETHRPWFWGSTKKPTLLVSLCMMHTAYIVTRSLDHPATEYPTCAWPSSVLYTRSHTSTMILITIRHVAPVTYTLRDKQTWFSTWIIGKNNRNIPESNASHNKSMTHHNQTKVPITWFLNLPLHEYIDNKKHKVWILNPRHMKHS
jgi:hypothetical protein